MMAESDYVMTHSRYSLRFAFAPLTVVPAIGLSGGAFHGPDLVWRAHVRECPKHITVRPYFISLHLSICQDGDEDVYDVVGE